MEKKTALAGTRPTGRLFTPAFLLLCLVLVSIAFGQNRFPRPEFQSDYSQPQTVFPAARAAFLRYVDVAVLFGALCLAAYLSLKKRSRKGIFLLMIGCLVYFGFYKMGCICPIGAIQNITGAVLTPGFALPMSIGLLFALPLLFALFFGRVFCSSICPLGAVQDLFVLKPQRIPAWLAAPLKLLPHAFLGAAVLFSATGMGYLICRTDPFVGIFRLSAAPPMIVWGALVLLIGIFVARPYCRFMCPYGLLLSWMSRLSKWRTTVSPGTCVNCRLCEDACPVDAIRIPTKAKTPEKRTRSIKRLLTNGMLLPVWIVAGATAGWFTGEVLSVKHPRAALARQIMHEQSGTAKRTTIDSETFRAGTIPIEQLVAEAENAERKIRFGALLLGAYLGAVTGFILIGQARQKKINEYSADPGECISCGRCFRFCPQEHKPNHMTIQVNNEVEYQ